MTKKQFIDRLKNTLNNEKECLINCSNIYCDEIKQKGQNKLRLEKYNFNAGQISMINEILNYIYLIEKEK